MFNYMFSVFIVVTIYFLYLHEHNNPSIQELLVNRVDFTKSIYI